MTQCQTLCVPVPSAEPNGALKATPFVADEEAKLYEIPRVFYLGTLVPSKSCVFLAAY